MNYFAGLDWGSAAHAACVVDHQGTVVARLDAPHTAQGLHTLLAQLARNAPPEQLPIAIERPSGLLVDTLVDAGHPVVPIHPNAVKASRPRYSAAGGKSDPGDAYILADMLRTDGHRFSPLRPPSDAMRALRALVHTRSALVAERVAFGNQLRALLDGFWPGAASLFAKVDSLISLAFLDRFPTPSKAARLGDKRMAGFLAANSYSGGRTPAELLERLRAAPTGLAGPIEEECKGELVKALVAVLRTLRERIDDIEKRIKRDMEALPLGRLVMSFPHIGVTNASQLLVELGDDPERFQTADQLAAEAGVCPVTHASGKHRGVVFRNACNKRLRVALTTWAGNSRFSSPWAADVYARARARGCTHPHAVRILARAWSKVLWRCWRNGTPYDAALHGAASRALVAARPAPTQDGAKAA